MRILMPLFFFLASVTPSSAQEAPSQTPPKLTQNEVTVIQKQIDQLENDSRTLIETTAKAMGRVSGLLTADEDWRVDDELRDKVAPDLLKIQQKTLPLMKQLLVSNPTYSMLETYIYECGLMALLGDEGAKQFLEKQRDQKKVQGQINKVAREYAYMVLENNEWVLHSKDSEVQERILSEYTDVLKQGDEEYDIDAVLQTLIDLIKHSATDTVRQHGEQLVLNYAYQELLASRKDGSSARLGTQVSTFLMMHSFKAPIDTHGKTVVVVLAGGTMVSEFVRNLAEQAQKIQDMVPRDQVEVRFLLMSKGHLIDSYNADRVPFPHFTIDITEPVTESEETELDHKWWVMGTPAMYVINCISYDLI